MPHSLTELASSRESPAASSRHQRGRDDVALVKGEHVVTLAYGEETGDARAPAPIAVTREVGELLYVLAAASGARRIVEYGASLGFSTVHLAAAARDAGAGGIVITTELDERKAELAAANLAEAGLADVVDLRVGDARETLAETPAPVDLLFLDGWNDLYLEILGLVEPRLRPGGLVVADLSADDPACDAYRARLEDPASGYSTITVPLDAGVAVSVRCTQH